MSNDQAVATPADAPLAAGSIVGGRYVLSNLLGRGGMAEVWQADDRVLERAVAVKIFRAGPVSEAEQSRQQAEIRLLAALSHPHLVTVFDAGSDGGCPEAPCSYLVMELVDGTTLARLLASGALAVREVADVGAQLASALAYVHARGVVHRDVKPANVLLTATPRSTVSEVTAKLTDFGVARVLDGSRLTMTGTTVGTANYLSPEQAAGSDVTQASDVYSLGLVLLECLSGELAFGGHGVEAALARLHRAPAIPEDLDPAWQGLLAAMTARDPAVRPPAAAVANRLRSLASSGAEAPGPGRLARLVETATTQSLSVGRGDPAVPAARAHPSLAVPAQGRRGHRRGWYLAAAVSAAVLAGLVVVLVLAGGPGRSGSEAVPSRPYPSVSGKLGTDLRDLELAIGTDNAAIARTTLRQDVFTLVSLAHDGSYADARRWVAQVQQDVRYARSAGALGILQENRINAVLDAVRADLAAGTVSSSASSSREPSVSSRNVAVAASHPRTSHAATRHATTHAAAVAVAASPGPRTVSAPTHRPASEPASTRDSKPVAKHRHHSHKKHKHRHHRHKPKRH